ncbi:glutamate decarboxylase [Streptomyces benahoarensis]|uniref:glutamate decarboxylase n=1 Tax=Streptomyces benahoarensis TaxID=2595054 RepID=UPI001C8F48A1|nr:glutamate decarboxylase [Streptomyces benahoarensis]
MIHDELLLDGSSRLNTATFVTTWMDPEAEKLMAETFDKNMIDKDEYPQTAEIERRCVNIVADLFHAPVEGDAVGVSTLGSSEAVMLGSLAMKWKWRGRRQAAGLRADRPNLVMGSNVQVVWEKFCRYWDVEPRYVPVASDRFTVDADETMAFVDENTIGVVPILGTTHTGEFEPIKAIHDKVVAYNAEHGTDIAIHVDAASGGFVAPFLHCDLEWDFRLPQVKSINVSGHKYGLTYPGIGFIVWRGAEDLPEDLVFHVNYLGGDMPTFTLNFSRPGNQVVGQCYKFVRLGREGYTKVMTGLRDTAHYLADGIAKLGVFDVISDGTDIPVVSFKLSDASRFTVFHVSTNCAATAGRYPPTPCRRTPRRSPSCASWSARASGATSRSPSWPPSAMRSNGSPPPRRLTRPDPVSPTPDRPGSLPPADRLLRRITSTGRSLRPADRLDGARSGRPVRPVGLTLSP